MDIKSDMVSVIVPVYKVEKYLAKCIDSIINQTYRNIEIILVDDGSPDNCGRICDLYESENRNIRVIHKQNGGLSEARNAGIEIAKGTFILFVDSDDWIEPGMVEHLVQLLQTHNADISVCGYFEDSESAIYTITDVEDELYIYGSGTEAVKALNYNGGKIGTVAWNKLYRSELFTDFRFDVGRLNEDVFIMPKLFYSANCVVVSTQKLYHYIVSRPDSIMNKALSEKNLDVADAFYSNYEFFSSCGETRFANLYWMKYYGTLIDMYCKFHSNKNSTVEQKIKKRLNEQFATFIKISISGRYWKDLFRGTLFKVASPVYFRVWSKMS